MIRNHKAQGPQSHAGDHDGTLRAEQGPGPHLGPNFGVLCPEQYADISNIVAEIGAPAAIRAPWDKFSFVGGTSERPAMRLIAQLELPIFLSLSA